MDALEAPHSVTDPVDTAPPQNETTGETVWGEIPLPLYLGMAATRIDDTTVKIGVSILDNLSTLDYFTWEFTSTDGEYMRDVIRKNTIHIVVAYSISDRAKFVGTGVTLGLEEICHGFCAYIWRKLDIVCVVSKAPTTPSGTHLQRDTPIDLDEQADLAAQTVYESTWKTVLSYANELMGYKDGQTNGNPQSTPIKIAFFSATPQGGGVALMRHAHIPEPNSEAFRITKTNHNILQEVADPEANLVIIDDPQMPALTPLIKKVRPEVEIIYRSHIEVRKDLVAIPRSPQRQVWEWIWNRIRKADVFISHPVSTFVPYGVPLEMVGLMPACSDWNHLLYPTREYITQIPRFDPSKCVPDVIQSYRKFCARLRTDAPKSLPLQLLIIDDPDAEIGYNQTIALLREMRYVPIAKDVIVVRIVPSDRMLNAMITTAKIGVQLSLPEGFEVKVAEALHYGKSIAATRAGGIPLQIDDGKSGFLVQVGDTDTVANCLFDLYTNDDLYATISKHAKASVSHEVGTDGNAACWLYLAPKLATGDGLEARAGWIIKMAKEEAGQKFETLEPMLPRS
ncbi:hypothetical protein HOY80DRAFT_1139796 [Tuber brumale]|nr:hypothetical protein HOY80DRAFT_1139796 [Tuber brumale]